jgi:photosystem II stability/assembly factor-like uncharacterized protein
VPFACLCKFSLGIGFCLSALFAGAATPAVRTLLVLAPHGCPSAVGKVAKISARIRGTHVYRLSVSTPMPLPQVKKFLQRVEGIEGVFDGGAERADTSSLASVDEHVRFLKALRGDDDNSKVPEGELGFWEAYRYFIQDRVNRNGKVVPKDRERALAHRSMMQNYQPSSSGGGVQPLVASGRWTNIGPSSIIPASRLFGGPSPVSGRVNAVEYDPVDPNVKYVGSAGGGLWKTMDGGQTWFPLTDSWPFLTVSAIAIDRTDRNTIYVGTGDFQGLSPYSFGIMKSTDGGGTWTNYGKALFGSTAISRVMIDPDDHNRVTVTTGRGYTFSSGGWNDWLHGGSLDGGQGALYQSTDAGATWTKRNPPFADWCGLDCSVADAFGKRTYWASGSYPNNGYEGTLWYSTDRGVTWSPAANITGNRLAVDVACSKVDRNTVYLLAPDSSPGAYPPYDGQNTSAIYKTTDGGLSWSDVTAGFPNDGGFPGYDGYAYNWSQGFYDYYIRTSTATYSGVSTDAVYVGLITLAMSPDGGQSWLDIGQSYSYDPTTGQSGALMHVDQHAFANNPLDPNTVLVGNDGGVFEVSFDPTSSTSAVSHLNRAGLVTTQHYKLAVDPSNPNSLLAGAQDNGTSLWTGNQGLWQPIFGGDGGCCAYDPKHPSTQYATSNGLNIAKTVDSWVNGYLIASNNTFPATERMQFIPPIAIGDAGEVYAGTDHLWKFVDGIGWTGDLGGQALSGSGSLRAIAPCHGSTRIYTGAQDGQVWTSPNSGVNWTRIDVGVNSLPGLPAVALAPMPDAPGDVLVGLSGYGGSHVWRCPHADAPAAARTWIDVSGSGSSGLPDVPVSSLCRDPYAPGTTWYAGTDVGVFITQNAGSTWQNMSSSAGLPNVQVTDMQISGGFLYAATYGRGIWRIRVANPATLTVARVSAPASLVGSGGGTATLQLNSPAAFGGTVVNLASSNTCLSVPSQVRVPNGAISVSFAFQTRAVYSAVAVDIAATLNGNAKATLMVTPGALASVSLPSPVYGGLASKCVATLTGPSPSGAVLKISSPNTKLSYPSSVPVPSGASSAQFSVTPAPVSGPVVQQITVGYLSLQRTATMTVLPPATHALTLSPIIVRGGDATAGMVQLSSPAPPAGWPFRIPSSSPLVTAPTLVTIPAGATQATFIVRSSKVASSTTVTILAVPIISGNSQTAALTLTP